MHDETEHIEDILRIDLEEGEWDFSTTKSFTDAVAKAQKEIARSFEESLAGVENARAAVKVKEPQPA
jgi:hypothetical protein